MPLPASTGKRARYLFVLSLLALALLLPPNSAQAVEIQEILDAIMEKRPPDLATMDLYADGVVDVLDLLVWLRTTTIDCDNSPPDACPRANFDLSSSAFGEDAGSVQVRVNLDIPYSGTLRYLLLNTYGDPDQGHIVGTAVEGIDFEAPGTVAGQGTVAVSGWSADIPIDILEEANAAAAEAAGPEGTETVILLLIPDTPATYTLGPLIQHVLSIEDDEITWSGTLALEGTELGGTLLLGRSDAGPFGRFLSVGHDTFPAGSWDLEGLDWTPLGFRANTEEIAVPCSASGAGVELRRVLEFRAEASDPEHLLDPDLIAGALSETILAPAGMEHLGRSSSGTFALAKGPPPPPAAEPVLFTP
jgi:hypothetical protein